MVYSGKPGCMCGCRGKYSYASDYKKEGGKERGYDVTDEDVSDRSVKLIVGKLMNNPNTKHQKWASREGYFLETPSRMIGAYVKKMKDKV
jgi:hypothetical protein